MNTILTKKSEDIIKSYLHSQFDKNQSSCMNCSTSFVQVHKN